MIAGPEVSHLVAQYETKCGTKAGVEHIIVSFVIRRKNEHKNVP